MRTKLLLIGIVAVSIASAQRGGRGGGGGGGMNLPVGGPYMKNHMEQMTDILQLSKEQKKDIKTLMDDAQKEAAPLREQLVKGRAQIAASVAGKPEGLEGAIKSYSELEGQMAAIEMKAFAGIYKALDQEQKAKASGVFRMMPGIFSQKNWIDLPQ